MENNYLNKLNERKKGMVDYLVLKLKEEDWHGVQDAASDIRDIEAERIGYEKGKIELTCLDAEVQEALCHANQLVDKRNHQGE